MVNFEDKYKYPQFISLDEERKKKYLEPLVNTRGTQFFGVEQGDVYFIAVALGFKNKIKEKSNKSKEVRTFYKLDDNYKLLIRTIVLSEVNYNYDILKDGTSALKIIEEYANGGIQILYDKIFSNTLDFSIEEELWNDLISIYNSK